MKFFKKKIFYRDKNFIQLGKEITTKVPYIIRYTLFTCKYFSIKIHKILMSDSSDMHDHPWDYISIILCGGYTEQSLNPNYIDELLDRATKYKTKKPNKYIWKWYKPGSILFRKASTPHRLIIPEGKFAISLIFTSYKYRL